MIDYKPTGEFYYETTDVTDGGQTIDESKWQLLSLASSKNLCDQQSDECSTDTYLTDDQWSITHHCRKHFDEYVKSGVFVRVPTDTIAKPNQIEGSL